MSWLDSLMQALGQGSNRGGAIGADQVSPMQGDTFGVGGSPGGGGYHAPAPPPLAEQPAVVDQVDNATGGSASAASGNLPGGGGAPLSTHPGSFWQHLAQLAQNPLVLQTAGQAISQWGEDAAARRHDRINDEGANMRKLQQADYLASGGRPYTPPAGTPSYGFGPTSTSAAVSAQAAKEQDELIKRMNEPTTPNFWEQLAQIAGPSLGVLGIAGAQQKPVAKPATKTPVNMP